MTLQGVVVVLKTIDLRQVVRQAKNRARRPTFTERIELAAARRQQRDSESQAEQSARIKRTYGMGS